MTTIFDNFFNDFHYMMTPVPPFPRGGYMFFHKFCIYFWKGWKGTWTSNGWVRHAIFSHHLLYPVHSTYYTIIYLWWWSFLTICVPHVDFHSTYWRFLLLIIIVDFHFWRVPLMMIFFVVYTFILVDLHWQSTLLFLMWQETS